MREELILLCERAIVPEDRWSNRDTATAQQKIGRCWALLKAGCSYTITTPCNQFGSIELEITYCGYARFQGREEDEKESFFLPTSETLDKANGEDWY